MNVDKSNGNHKRIRNLLRSFEKEFFKNTVIIFEISKDEKGEPIKIKFTRITKKDIEITTVNPEYINFLETYLGLIFKKNDKNSQCAPFGDLESFVNVMTNKDPSLQMKVYLPNM